MNARRPWLALAALTVACGGEVASSRSADGGAGGGPSAVVGGGGNSSVDVGGGGASGHDRAGAGAGGSVDVGACDGPGECTVASGVCCGVCPSTPVADLVSVNVAAVEAFYAAGPYPCVAGDECPGTCESAGRPVGPIGVCDSGHCVMIDVPHSAYATCGADTDCTSVVLGCSLCGPRVPLNHSSVDAVLAEAGCTPSGPRCNIDWSPDDPGAHCDASTGFCALNDDPSK